MRRRSGSAARTRIAVALRVRCGAVLRQSGSRHSRKRSGVNACAARHDRPSARSRMDIIALLGSAGDGRRVSRTRTASSVVTSPSRVLPTHFAKNPDGVGRFTREARLLATLSHPHIGAIYGLEETDGLTALVLELVEGPTLAERLAARGRLPPTQALTIARADCRGPRCGASKRNRSSRLEAGQHRPARRGGA